MVFSFAKPTCVVALTLGILIGLGSRATAATIVQSATYNFAILDTNWQFYNQFDPSLGTLSDVLIQCQGGTFQGYFEFYNPTMVNQTFNGSVSYSSPTDAGTVNVSNTFTLTLGPGQSVAEGAGTTYDLSASYGSSMTSFWVGDRAS